MKPYFTRDTSFMENMLFWSEEHGVGNRSHRAAVLRRSDHTSTATAQTDIMFSEQILRIAITRAITRHPMLRARFHVLDATKCNCQLQFFSAYDSEVIAALQPSVEYSQETILVDSDKTELEMLEIVVSEALDRERSAVSPWKENPAHKALWYLRAHHVTMTKEENTLNYALVMLGYHHAIGDGMSIGMLLHELLASAEVLASSELGAPADAEKRLESLFPMKMEVDEADVSAAKTLSEEPWHLGAWWRWAKRSWRDFSFARKEQPILKYLYDMVEQSKQQDENTKRKVYSLLFDQEQTSQILRAAKSNGATITGALAAASSLAFALALRDYITKHKLSISPEIQEAIRQQNALSVRTLVNMRTRFTTPLPNDVLTCALMNVATSFSQGALQPLLQIDKEISDEQLFESFWKIATETTNDLREVLESEVVHVDTAFINSRLIREVTPVKKVNLPDEPPIGQCNYITNVGVVPGVQKHYSAWELLFFAVIARDTNRTRRHILHTASTTNGNLAWTIAGYELLNCAEVTADFARHAKRLLLQCSTSKVQ